VQGFFLVATSSAAAIVIHGQRKGGTRSRRTAPSNPNPVRKEFQLNTIVAEHPDGQPVSELLTADEAAALLNVTPRWVKAVGGPSGIIPSVKIGEKYRRYPNAALLAWVEQQQTGGR
jgi:hypothetical protein